MTELHPSEPEPAAPTDADDGGLDRLRELLVGRERAELVELGKRLDRHRVSAEEVSQVLPEAVTLRTRRDSLLADTLTPTIENAIAHSVQRNPRPLTDAIFPLIGPAIRKALREALATLVEGINRTVEHSLSPQGIRWRIEARRTGRPFAEVVLKHSLVFRVEEVFLIHRDAALALEHMVAPTITSRDPDLISSMLGAIQDFVADSFAEGEGGHVAQIEFGDRQLLVAQGPAALVACTVRGLAPTSLRSQVQEALERIHAELGKELGEFDGDDAPFLTARPVLEELLLEERAKTEKRSRPPWPILACGAVLLVLAILWIVHVFQERRQWSRAKEAVASEVGIVVTEAHRADGRYVFSGLRDPLAADPKDVIEGLGLDRERVEDRFVAFPSSAPALVVERARRVLQPPATVTLAFDDGHLALRGQARHSWIAEATQRAAGLAGVDAVDREDLLDLDLRRVEELAARVEARGIPFASGAQRVDEAEPEVIAMREDLQSLEQAVAGTGIALAVTVVGHVAAGEPEALGLDRARAVGSLLERCPSLLHLAPVASAVPDAARATLRIQRLADQTERGRR